MYFELDQYNIRMRSHNKLRSIVTAAVIVVAAVAIPILVASHAGVREIKPNSMTVAVVLLYAVAVVGLVLISLGKYDVQLTSNETDRRLGIVYKKTMIWLASSMVILACLWFLWMTRRVWLSSIHAWLSLHVPGL